MNASILRINLDNATHFIEATDDMAAPIIKKGNIAILSEVPIKNIVSVTTGIFMTTTDLGSKHFFRGVRSKGMFWMFKLDNSSFNPKYQIQSLYRVEAIFNPAQELPEINHYIKI